MSHIRFDRFVGFAAGISVVALVFALASVPAAQALTSSQDLCVNTMNKSGSKVAKTQGKENASCVKDFGSGKLTGTAQDCLTADRKGKINKATGKTATLESKKCSGSPPSYGYTGSATTNQSAIDQEVALTTDVFGTPIDNALVSASTDKTAATCQAVVVKAYEKYGSIFFKDFTVCKKTELKDFPDSIQEISDCIGADVKGKFGKIRGKILTMIQKKCAGVDLQATFPGVCQAQATSDTGLADCLADRVECRSCEAMVGMDGIPASIRPCDLVDNGVLDASCGGCGNGIIEAPEECDDAGESATCDTDCTLAVCGDGTLNPTAGEQCDDNNSNPDDGCTDNCTICGDGIVTPPEECDDGNLISGDGCSSRCTCSQGIEFGCQDPQCPNAGELTVLAGVGKQCATNADCNIGDGRLPAAEGAAWCDTSLAVPRCRSLTELDTGWTGIAHDSDVSDRAVTMGRLVCPGPAPTCGVCAVVGIDPTPRNCRCANDPRTICDEPFQADANDCGGDTCECYFGPPIPLSSGNVPACAINRFAENVSGTANVDTGEGVITAKLATLVYLGDLIHTPCPYCYGDVTPGDGVRDGTCVLGDHDGLPCDVDAFNSTFPADPTIPGNTGQGNTSNSGMSLDCWPPSGKNVSGGGLNLRLDQTTGTSSLPPASIPCGFIRKCSDEPRTFCATNGDCGTCASNADCAGGNGVCDGSGRCSCEPGPTCRDDANFNVRCEEFDNTMCKTCATNTDCPGIATCQGGHCECLPKNTCADDRSVLCWSNADCGGCTTNADCGPPLGGGVCDGSGQCSCGPAISKCFCGLCSDDELIACSSEAECGTCVTNADCPGSGNVAPGTCIAGHCSCERRNDNGDPLPNQCDGGVCQESPPGSGEGVCTNGPADNLCDGVVRADGEGFLQCLSNGDCTASGFNGGTCTLTKQRKCFLDPITATGVQDPNKPVAVATFCIPRTASDGINSVAGLPGPARVTNQASSRIFCASNPSVLYEPGVGGCP